MKLGSFLKDKIVYIFGTIFVALFVIPMGYAFKVDNQFIAAVVVMIFFALIVGLLTEYRKKSKFYRQLLFSLDHLDKKYLVSELVEKPDFADAHILADVLYETNKAMVEHIGDIETETSDFKEYLEMWIHEIKIPISGLTLMNYNGNTDLKKQKRQIDKLNYYVEQILFYSRAGMSEKDYLLSRYNLESIINKNIKDNKDLLIGNKVKIEKENLNYYVTTDSKWLDFILGQVISNSVKYMKEAPCIKFYCEDKDDRVILYIEDNGIGISENDLPRVFDKTFTGENGRNAKVSTGMGLYICKMLCDKLGHRISISSVKDKYTRVAIAFGKNKYYEM